MSEYEDIHPMTRREYEGEIRALEAEIERWMEVNALLTQRLAAAEIVLEAAWAWEVAGNGVRGLSASEALYDAIRRYRETESP